MKITKHAQSCFLIETGKSCILIDPGSYVFGEEGIKPEDFSNIDLIAFTHEHANHFDFDNVVKIIKANKPIILGTQAIADKLKGISKVEIIGNNYKGEFFDFSIEGYLSKHGQLPTGAEPPEVCGIVIDNGDHRLYTPGDSVYLNQETNADIVVVPICGQVVMDINQAKSELLKLKPKFTLPIHYDNPRFPVNVDDFAEIMKDTGIKTKVLKWGKLIEL